MDLPPPAEAPRRAGRSAIGRFLGELRVLCRALPDPEVPWYVKLLLFLIVAYVLSPIDLIPDFIPVLGLLDEAILVPLALKLALRLTPPAVLQRYATGQDVTERWRWLERAGIILIAGVWIGVVLLTVFLVRRL